MSSFKLPMRKYLTIIYTAFSVMSFAQYTDNVFDNDQPTTDQQQHTEGTNTPVTTESIKEFTPNEMDQSTPAASSSVVPDAGEHEEGPGNPGEPVPVNGYVPLLLLSGLALIFYSQRKNKKINI